jgi:hypothetical protein
MRFVGAALLIGGFLLCVSIVWAALGFLMMGLGLICFLIAERRNERLPKSTASQFDESNPRREQFLLPQFLDPEPKLALVSSEEDADQQQNASSPQSYDEETYDKEKWNSLVENDPDFSRLVKVLALYGQKYVDELAKAYLVLKDKDYLPMILEKIVTTAKIDAGQDVASEVVVGSNPKTGVISNNRTRGLRANRVRDPRAVHYIAKDKPALVNTPQIDLDAKQKRMSAQSARGRPEGGSTAAAREIEPEGADASRAVKVAATAPAAKEASRVVALDDADNLTDLLKRLGSEFTKR